MGWEAPRFHTASCDTPDVAEVTTKTRSRVLTLCTMCMHERDETVVGNLLRCAIALHAVSTSTKAASRQTRRFPGRHVSETTFIESRTADGHIHRVLVDSYSNASQRLPGIFDAAQNAIDNARSSTHAQDLAPLAAFVETMLTDAHTARVGLRESWIRRLHPRPSQPCGTHLAIFRRDDLRPALFETGHVAHRDIAMTLTVTDPVAVLWDSEYTGNDLYAYLVPEHQSLTADLATRALQPAFSVPSDVDPDTIQVLLSLLPGHRLTPGDLRDLFAATDTAVASA